VATDLVEHAMVINRRQIRIPLIDGKSVFHEIITCKRRRGNNCDFNNRVIKKLATARNAFAFMAFVCPARLGCTKLQAVPRCFYHNRKETKIPQ